MFEPIKRLIKYNQTQNPKFFLTPQICYLAAEAIKEFVPQAANKVSVVSYQDSRLKIASSDPMILHQIKMGEEKIIEAVQKKTGIKKFRIIYSPRE
jgi:hypothetical protein